MGDILKSRKFWIAVGAAAVSWAKSYGLVTPEVAVEVVTLAKWLIGSIAAEDAAKKFGLPPVTTTGS